jgi:hypothetical protein
MMDCGPFVTVFRRNRRQTQIATLSRQTHA